jgi:Rrf2 family protein
MKISTKGRYAVRALVELAMTKSIRPVLLAQIAQRQEIPERYLIQIFGSLRQAGLVNSFRGAKGGFHLARPAEAITLAEILEAAEGSLQLVDCLQADYARCSRYDACFARAVWSRINDQVRMVFSNMTLAHMADLHATEQSRQGASYQI